MLKESSFMIAVISILLSLIVISFLFLDGSRYARIIVLENLSKKFPPSSLQSKRLSAIARALKTNKDYYYFSEAKPPAPLAGR